MLAQVKPSSTIWAAVNTSPSSRYTSSSMAWWSADRRSRNSTASRSCSVSCPAPGRHEAGHVLVGDGVVLARLHARLALAQLRAADADELEDAAAEQALLPHHVRAVLVMSIWAVR